MKQIHLLLVVVMLALLALACQAASSLAPTKEETDPSAEEAKSAESTPESPTSLTTPTEVSQSPASSTDEADIEAEKALGTLSLERDKVEHGPDVETLKQVVSSEAFFAQDAIRVTEGGEALLDFGDQILMRMFNDTEMQVVSADYAEDTPPVVVMHLFKGGFTGQLTAEGAQVFYETPGGAAITVLGTDYFVAYDPDTEVTSAGNFSGQVEATSAGSTVMIEEGFYVEVPAGQPPGPQQPLPLSHADFEGRARALQSPLSAVAEAGEWLLEMSWDWISATDAHIGTVTWSGNFRVNEGVITGEGTGTITDALDDTLFHQGEFQFDISGQFVRSGDDKSAFHIEIIGHGFALEINLDECDESSWINLCDDIEKYIRVILQSVAEGFPLQTLPIKIDAIDGTTTMVELDESSVIPKLPSGYEDFTFVEPVTVTVNSVAVQSRNE